MNWKNVLAIAVIVLVVICLCSLVYGATLLLRRSFLFDQQVELPTQESVEEPTPEPEKELEEPLLLELEGGVTAIDPVELEGWPQSPDEAAEAFLGDEAYTLRFEQNSFGGWHLIEGDPVTVTVPVDVILEAYHDFGTANRSPAQGGHALCWTVLGNEDMSYKLVVIGGTFWQPDRDLTPGQTASKILSEQVPFREMPGNVCVAVGLEP